MTSGPVLAAFERHVAERPAALAVWSRADGRRVGFAGLSDEVSRLRSAFAEALPGGADERHLPVAVALGNTVAFVAATLALWRLDVPVVAVDASLSPAARRDLCRRLRVRHLLERAAMEVDGPPALPFAVAGLRLTRLDVAEPTRAPAGTCLVKLTSGSTGEPVGSCLSQACLAAGINQIAAGMAMTSADTVLLTIPLSHSYGFDHGLLSLVVLGAPLVLEPSRYPAPLLQALVDSQATVLPLVPPLVRALGQTAWPVGHRLRLAISAGGPLPDDAARTFRQAAGVPVQQFYGSTESGGICFEAAGDDPAAVGTVGQPLPGVTIELDDDGRVGVSSAANYLGHFGVDLEVRQRTVYPGDRAEWTPEGRLRLLGRSAEILNVGGRKVAAAAIEEALRGLAGVQEAAVVGIADDVRGQRIIAFVVGSCGQVDTASLPLSLMPREIRRLSALPYTDRGKLDRAALLRLASDPA
jgi:acyl-coenzyme A synthetase/AMP-(fatty) acid ligase